MDISTLNIILGLSFGFIALYWVFYIYRKDLRAFKKIEVNLTKSLEDSEKNRAVAEREKDKVTTIINNFSDGIIILDQENKFSSINPEAIKILGLEAGELPGKSFQFMSYFPKAKPLASVLDMGIKNISRKEIKLSEDFIIELSVIPLKLNKKDLGHLIVLHDVSREKMVEKMKTEFVSLAAHQLRTPLSRTKWSMSMLKNGYFGKLTSKQNTVVKNTFESNEDMIAMVNNLLDVARIEEGRYSYKAAMTDITKIIDLAVDLYKKDIKEKNIKIDFKKPSNFPQVMLDAERFKIVVQNLIDNAVKYSPVGGKIVISLKSDNKNIELKVQDFGIGIPKTQKDKIFTKFFRADNALKINAIGTGLGLFMAKNIIESHGGKMWFDSEENLGTSFYISLPVLGKNI